MRKRSVLVTQAIWLYCNVNRAGGRPGPPPSAGPAREYRTCRQRAEALYAEGCTSGRMTSMRRRRSSTCRGGARLGALPLADTLWRAQAATKTADETKYDRARARARGAAGGAGTGRRRATLSGPKRRVAGRLHLAAAGSSGLVRRLGALQGGAKLVGWVHGCGSGARPVPGDLAQSTAAGAGAMAVHAERRPSPLDVLENAVQIAKQPADVAFAHYALAARLRQENTFASQQRVRRQNSRRRSAPARRRVIRRRSVRVWRMAGAQKRTGDAAERGGYRNTRTMSRPSRCSSGWSASSARVNRVCSAGEELAEVDHVARDSRQRERCISAGFDHPVPGWLAETSEVTFKPVRGERWSRTRASAARAGSTDWR